MYLTSETTLRNRRTKTKKGDTMRQVKQCPHCDSETYTVNHAPFNKLIFHCMGKCRVRSEFPYIEDLDEQIKAYNTRCGVRIARKETGR